MKRGYVHIYISYTALVDTYISAIRTIFYCGWLDSAVGRSDGQYSARQCCRGREFDSRCGS